MDGMYWVQKFFDLPVKNYEQRGHEAAENEWDIIISAEFLEKLVVDKEKYEIFMKKFRQETVKALFESNFDGFNIQPYENPNNAIKLGEQNREYEVNEVKAEDELDILLAEKFDNFREKLEDYQKYYAFAKIESIEIGLAELLALENIYLWKDKADLEFLWYELVSYRKRTNNDKDYRRYNIKTAFENIGNLRFIEPNEIFNLAREFHYSPGNTEGKKIFAYGYAIFGDAERKVYGGGLCGVATAFFQGTLTNKGLKLVERSEHSIRYRNLYEADINGKYIETPGLDATVYTPHYNVKVKNIRDYPIILVFNYDGEKWHQEEMFTLARENDKWSFEYQSSYWKQGRLCYLRKVNGKNVTGCYRKVKAS